MTRAAIDIGTNTVRLLILADDGADLERRYVVTGLGRGVDGARAFRTDSVEHTLAVLREYRRTIDRHGPATVRVVATSATRDVQDGGAFLDEAERVLGLRPEVISGDEEAALAFRGGTRGAVGEPPTLVIDVGGGSTELIYGGNQPEYAISVDIGSVRLGERALPDRPASTDQLRAARREADRVLGDVELPGRVATAIGIGGTFTTLATLSYGLHYRAPVHGARLTWRDNDVLIDRLAGLTIEGTAALEGLDPARAPVILGGAIVVARAMHVADVEAVTVSEHDLLDGIALSAT